MGIKYNTKEKSLINRGGGYSIALCYEIGLLVSLDDMTTVGFFSEKKQGWIISEKPYYSSGGWGSGTSGDRDGAYTYSLSKELLDVIEARVYTVNISDLSDLDAFEKLESKRLKIVSLKNKAKSLGLSPDLSDFEKTGLKLELIKPYKSSYGRESDQKISCNGRGFNPSELVAKHETSVETFLENKKSKELKVDGYSITQNQVSLGAVLVAVRTSENKIVLNSQALQVSVFERDVLGGQSIIQKRIRQAASLSIPFNILQAANLDLKNTKVLEQGPEEDHSVKGENRHFTGSMLLENSGRKFLMDLDRIEIAQGIWNTFFVEVASHVETIAQAYDSMKPESVKLAESQGIETKRQGEWFFIKTGKTVTVNKDQIIRWARRDSEESKKFGIIRSDISHGKGRPNSLYKVQNSEDASINGLVCGVVTHSGREHGPLCLGGQVTVLVDQWNQEKGTKQTDFTKHTELDRVQGATLDLWEVVPNTTIGNFTIQGDID